MPTPLRLLNPPAAPAAGTLVLAHDDNIRALVAMPDGLRLLSADTSGTLRLWGGEGEKLFELHVAESADFARCDRSFRDDVIAQFGVT
jgi:hypothetical protein